MVDLERPVSSAARCGPTLDMRPPWFFTKDVFGFL
jgi:hypothetical protein